MSTNVEELRKRYRELVPADTGPEVWLAMALADLRTAAAEVAAIHLADTTHNRHMVAEHVRLLLHKVAATTEEAIAAVERAEGLSGPIRHELANGEMAEILADLRAAVRGGGGQA